MELTKQLPVINNLSSPVNLSQNIKNNLISGQPQGLNNSNPDKDEFLREDLKTKVEENKKIITVSAVLALGAAALTAVFMRGKNLKAMEKFKNQATRIARDEAYKNTSDLRDSANKILRECDERITKSVDAATSGLKDELERVSSAVSSGDAKKGLFDALKKQIDEFELDYDATKPPTNEAWYNRFNMDFLPFRNANKRADMQKLDLPEFRWGERWTFEMPSSTEVKPSVAEDIKFTPFAKRQTNIALAYANSVKWDDDKMARDLLQNFYDGHGQTLDGVKFDITPLANGRSKIRIEGKGLYTPDKAILLGESSKSNDPNAAGNFGEGLKATVLKILKDKGAPEVNISSDGWRVSYDIADSDIGDRKVLQYSLEKLEKSFNGNFIEFETDSKDFASSIRKTIGHFYHSGNADFKATDFENPFFGIKVLNQGEKGKTYIAGQRFEYEKVGQWEGIDGFSVFFKQKPPTEIFNPSRDRIAMDNEDIKRMVEHFAKNDSTSNEELLNAMRSVEHLWTNLDEKAASRSLLEGMLSAASEKGMRIKFPDNYIAKCSGVSDDLIQSLESSGYKVCLPDFQYIGMRNVKEFMSDARNHNAFEMTDVQTKKVGLIRAAMQKLSSYLGKDFTPEELRPKVYLFDATSDKEAKNYKDALAEAITSYLKSEGFWIDRKYLDTASFDEIMGTTLHELTHKFGGDGKPDFSYKLTDVLENVIKAAADDKNKTFIAEWQNMNKLWNELNVPQAA